MRTFRALFKNPQGLRVVVFFKNPNWAGVEAVAVAALARDTQHAKYGPWTYAGADLA